MMIDDNATATRSAIETRRLSNGIPLLAEPMPGYHTTALILRVNGGMSSEPADQLGLAGVIEEALDKGTARFGGRELADAFDEIGASHGIYTGRQGWAFSISALPEFIPHAIELLGEVICHCTFPDDAVKTAVTLSQQQLLSLEDSPRGLLRRQMALQAYGERLGRHPLGRSETLARISSAGVRRHWQHMLQTGGMTIAVAGRVQLDEVQEALEKALADVPSGDGAAVETEHDFNATRSHLTKPFDQTQLGISLPGVRYDDPDFPIERVLLAVLSGGMSARLFTEVREKRGLVYWVDAWHEQPRGLGMVHVGAATTPQRCAQTYETLLTEIARLGDDLREDELERAKIGLISERVTSGASPQRHATNMLVDYFHLGRVVPSQQKEAALRAVSVDDIRRYVREQPRDALSVVTVGKEQPQLAEESAG
jgi:predicted Zn-dependent peptidase